MLAATQQQTSTALAHEDTVAYEVMQKLGAEHVRHPILDQIDLCIKHNIVPFLEGQPGVAKSRLVYQLAKEKDYKMIEFRPALEDLSGIKGLPNFIVVDEAGTQVVDWALPTHFPRDPNWKGIFFIDEIVKAAPSMQGALSQLVLDRRVGGYTLPKGAIIILAGNRTKDRAAAFKMPTDLANRVSKLPVSFELEAWTTWAIKNKLPNVGIAFATFKSGLMDSFDSSSDVNCTPRTFVKGINLIDEDPLVAGPVLTGLIGEGPAALYMGFYNHWTAVPSMSAIIERGATMPVPDKPDVQYATLIKISESVTEENVAAVNKFVKRFPMENQTMFWRSAVLRNQALAGTKELGDWITSNQVNLKN